MDPNALPKPAIPGKQTDKVQVYLLEAWHDGDSGVSYDSGRAIEVTAAQAELLIRIGTAQTIEAD
jgi:hypothetical protein